MAIDTTTLVSILFALGAIIFIRYHWNRLNLYKCANKFPGPLALPIIGNVACLVGLDTYNLLKGLDFLFKLYPSPGRLWLGPQLFIYIYNPEDIEIVMNDTKLSTKGDLYLLMKKFVGNGLVSGSGPVWKAHRKYITQTMSIKMLEKSMTIFNEQAKILMDIIKSKGEETFDCNHYLENCASDIILETIGGVKTNFQQGENEQVLTVVRIAYRLVHERMLKPWIHNETIYQLTNVGKKSTKATGIFHSFLKELILEKQKYISSKSEVEIQDMKMKKEVTTIEQLIMLNNNGEFTDEELMFEMATMYVAGQDTLAITSSWIFLMLAMHPDIQDKVYNEICEVMAGRMDSDLTPDDYPKFKYLDLVIKEVVRLFPIAPFMVRRVLQDTQLTNPDHVAPAGSQIVMSMWHLHRSPLYWDKPNEFIPERFLPEASKNRHPFAYIPFSAGLRSCIGQKFAYLALKTITYHCVRSNKLWTNLKYDQLDIRTDITIRSNSGYDLRLTKR